MPANPGLFRELNVPFESTEKANEVFNAFFKDVGELREKHKLPNVYMICVVTTKNEDGEESQGFVNAMYGDQTLGEMMTAWALGQEQVLRQERVMSLLSKGLKKGKREP